MVIAIGAGLCRPFAYNWDKTIEGGRCGALNAAYISIAALDILGDAMIIALPMPSVWRLQTSTATKIGLTVIFTLGLLDIIVAILRIVYLINFINTPDYTSDAYPTYLWAIVEVGLGTTVACAPTLRTLVTALVPMVKKSLSSYSSGYPRKFQRGPEHYSNISNGEIPLRPYTGFDTKAPGSKDSNPFEAVTITQAAAGSDSAYWDSQDRVSDPEVIRVQKDVSVQRGPRRSASTQPSSPR
ncbi:MAG: hypothetical protein Q9166_006931 [cf. Caloplaca sp. 2 TL-2023]